MVYSEKWIPRRGCGVEHKEMSAMLPLCLMVFETDEEREIFIRFHQRYERKMYAVALSILQEHYAAEDAVSTAFAKMAENFEKYQKIFQNPCQKTEAWCVIIVKNICTSYLRKEQRLTTLDERWDAPAIEDTESSAVYHDLVSTIRSLPDTYRTVLELGFVLDWSTKKIARELGIRENTVSARISRGRKLLQQILQKEGYRNE